MGAFWVRAPYAELLGPGTHGTTFGGTPLACAVALKILEVIEREDLSGNVRRLGDSFRAGLERLCQQYPKVFVRSRGLGFMLGIELADNPAIPGDPGKMQSVRFASLLHNAGLLTIPAGAQIIRFLPALNLRPAEVEEGLSILAQTAAKLAG
jgi:acetylornithine aminotransferase/acetylornithine/N-succinyldiaminopimelate aminotransferase